MYDCLLFQKIEQFLSSVLFDLSLLFSNGGLSVDNLCHLHLFFENLLVRINQSAKELFYLHRDSYPLLCPMLFPQAQLASSYKIIASLAYYPLWLVSLLHEKALSYLETIRKYQIIPIKQ